MTLLSFLGNIVATPVTVIRQLLESTTRTLEQIEKTLRTPDRDVQINELKARIEHLESLVRSNQ
jgi:hypothetical protein